MKTLVKINYTLFLLIVILSASAQAAFVSTVFEELTLDASLNCDRILLKNSSQNKNSATLIPHFIPGSLLEGKDAYTIKNHPQPKDNKKFLLNIRIFFPSNDELALSRRNRLSKRDLNTCKWDLVREFLNRDLPASEKIRTISRGSLSAIEMTIPGIEATATIGKFDSIGRNINILDYSGKFITLTFPITDNERKYFQDNVVVKNGIQALVKLYFQTRDRQSSFTVSVDRETLVSNFTAQINASAKFVSQADVSTALQKAMKQTKVTVTQEGTLSDQNEQLKAQAVSQMLSQMNDLFVPPTLDTKLPSAGSAPPAEQNKVTVKAALEMMKTQMKTDFSFASYSEPITASTERQVDLASYRTNDPNIVEVKLTPRDSDPATGIELKPGQLFSIALAYYQQENIKYETEKEYATKSMLNNSIFRNSFPVLRDPSCGIVNENVNDEIYATSSLSFLCHNKYRWATIFRFPDQQTVGSGTLVLTPETFNKYPVYISFDGLNKSRLFSLAQLFTRNEYFSAYFEPMSGRIFIAAKRDLGRLYLRIRAKDKTPFLTVTKKVEIQTESLIQEVYSVFNNLKPNSSLLIPLQVINEYVSARQSLTFFVSRPVTYNADDVKFLKSLPPPLIPQDNGTAIQAVPELIIAPEPAASEPAASAPPLSQPVQVPLR